MDEPPFDYPACLDRVRSGDEAAARALVEALYPLLLRIVRAHRPQRQGEEDMMQEIFLKMFHKLPLYQARAEVPFPHWVSRLAVRTCLDTLRAERRRPELRWSDLSESERLWLDYLAGDTQETPFTEGVDTRDLVETLLAQLSPKDRLILTWADLEEKSVAEISHLTGWNRTLVKVRTFRARQRLRRLAQDLRKDRVR